MSQVSFRYSMVIHHFDYRKMTLCHLPPATTVNTRAFLKKSDISQKLYSDTTVKGKKYYRIMYFFEKLPFSFKILLLL